MADVYQTTPLMSVYLLCLIVCDFEFVQSTSPRGHVVSSYITKKLGYKGIPYI